MKEQKRGKDFDKLIIEAVQGNYSIFAWQSIGGVVEKCELKIRAFRKDYNEIELEARPQHEETLSKVISGNRILNIYIPEVSVSFTAELKSVDAEKRVKVYLPRDYSFFERRKHERLQPTKTCYVSFELNRMIIKKAIFDVSLGGIAIVLAKSDKVIVAKGREFTLMILEIEGKHLKVKAECTNSFSIDRYKVESLPYGGYKVAFRFTDISEEDRAFLMDFITQQSLIQLHMKKAN